MKPIMELIVALFLSLIFDVVTLRWGFKSGDGWNNPEWVRRQNWKDFLWYRCCKDLDWVPDDHCYRRSERLRPSPGTQTRHLFMTASISTLCDVILILLRFGGLGASEVVFVSLWYIGAINHVPVLDFMRATSTAVAMRILLVY